MVGSSTEVCVNFGGGKFAEILAMCIYASLSFAMNEAMRSSSNAQCG